MKIRTEYTCPLEIVHDILKGKWKTLLIFQLQNGGKSLAELQRDISGITQKMLLEQLAELKKFGVVNKNKGEGYPLHVEYYLTERGQQLLQAVIIMQQVGITLKEEEMSLWVLRKQLKKSNI
jgi:DNA-binding HxlR family transcriptional regulator